ILQRVTSDHHGKVFSAYQNASETRVDAERRVLTDLPRLTARRNRPNQFRESESLTSNQNPSRAFRAVDKILDNSRQNFFAHVRDLSNCEKIAIRATRIMPAR
ncbi:MAG: hypothetical protein DMF22_05105, partial [Verrucomicrobia bacterium]